MLGVEDLGFRDLCVSGSGSAPQQLLAKLYPGFI